MSKSASCLCCGLSLVQFAAQVDEEDTGAGRKAKFDDYQPSYLARTRLGRDLYIKKTKTQKAFFNNDNNSAEEEKNSLHFANLMPF
ncbi:hypothetical protein llap_10316 [Limosa lapponica baueri]|uniref:Secreted protein n=1 Tax=Limosa lapponica baueri TaxID=1758121 RepID=A0A2I0U020_LIMLA|nr:hypothetical protein llap_10316 [Limosa lapponica baueri]